MEQRVAELHQTINVMRQQIGQVNWDKILEQFNEPELMQICIKLMMDEVNQINKKETVQNIEPQKEIRQIKAEKEEFKPALWTNEQTTHLRLVVDKCRSGSKIDWKLVAQKCGRTVTECATQYKTQYWTKEQEAELERVVAEQKEKNGEANWEQIDKLFNRIEGESRYRNDYLESKKQKQQWNKILGEYWEANHENFDLEKVLPQTGYSLKGASVVLQFLTDPNASETCQYKPQYVPADEAAIAERQKQLKFEAHINLMGDKFWTEQKVAQLNEIVESAKQKGKVDWQHVAQQLNSKSKDCKLQYSRRWTKEQEAELKLLVEDLKNKNEEIIWRQVGELLNRDGHTCKGKYAALTKQWTTEQDEILGKYWEANFENFDLKAIPRIGHGLSEAKTRLQELTDPTNGKYKPQYVAKE